MRQHHGGPSEMRQQTAGNNMAHILPSRLLQRRIGAAAQRRPQVEIGGRVGQGSLAARICNGTGHKSNSMASARLLCIRQCTGSMAGRPELRGCLHVQVTRGGHRCGSVAVQVCHRAMTDKPTV